MAAMMSTMFGFWPVPEPGFQDTIEVLSELRGRAQRDDDQVQQCCRFARGIDGRRRTRVPRLRLHRALSSAGSSPSVPATASPRPGNAVEIQAARRSTRRRFPPLRNSSRPDCHPLEPPNSSVLAGQRLTESLRRCVEVGIEVFRALRVIHAYPVNAHTHYM